MTKTKNDHERPKRTSEFYRPYSSYHRRSENLFPVHEHTDSESEVFYFYYQGLDWKSELGSSLRDWVMAEDQWVWNLEN
ncbi:hypothetical protein FKX85_15865 [Echinicola soli]|uniref:Uncharacterized protein n=1 Tax=Echinicola soli TaxID=2591634 RepID=A0A514CKT2_9BACT|nr:hypothetical protein [Echinicola soli]QDH80436.1 hypothetical protein FKX85_15865 [Echinicola soli]